MIKNFTTYWKIFFSAKTSNYGISWITKNINDPVVLKNQVTNDLKKAMKEMRN